MSHPWYALLVKSRHEDMVTRHLQARGFESFLPQYRGQHRWSDRFKEIDLPLFPGYVFCRFDLKNRLPVLTVPGVVHALGVGKIPVPINDHEVAAIHAAVKSRLARQPWPYLEIGHRVKIAYGPLCGFEGILLSFKGHQRLVLSVTLLRRSVAVEVDQAWVQPFPQHWIYPRPVVSQPPSSGAID